MAKEKISCNMPESELYKDAYGLNGSFSDLFIECLYGTGSGILILRDCNMGYFFSFC